ncbi:MAG: hypothetical protein JHC33_03670 [Ignisphaera sp.]|nr:hypothetical protein [Ignisphaera sp.]
MPIKFNKDAIPVNRNIVQDKDQISEFKSAFGRASADSINEHIRRDIIPSLGPKNFQSRAIKQLEEQGIPLTNLAVSQMVATLMKNFVKSDSWARYNSETGDIEMDQIAWDCEYGTTEAPVLKTVTRSIADVTENRG